MGRIDRELQEAARTTFTRNPEWDDIEWSEEDPSDTRLVTPSVQVLQDFVVVPSVADLPVDKIVARLYDPPETLAIARPTSRQRSFSVPRATLRTPLGSFTVANIEPHPEPVTANTQRMTIGTLTGEYAAVTQFTNQGVMTADVIYEIMSGYQRRWVLNDVEPMTFESGPGEHGGWQASRLSLLVRNCQLI